MTRQPSDRLMSRKAQSLRALAVFALGLMLTGSLSYFIYQIQSDRQIESQKALAAHYALDLERDLTKRVHTIAPIVDQVLIEQKRPSRELVMSRLTGLDQILGNFSHPNGFSFLSWVPVWVGRNQNGDRDIVALESWHKEEVVTFIGENQHQWEEQISKPRKKQGRLIGVDFIEKQGGGFFVVGHPFFQQIDLIGSGLNNPKEEKQFPLGFLVGWLDIAQVMRSSWDVNRNPDYLIYLNTGHAGDENKIIAYQAGIVEIIDSSKMHPRADDGQRFDFSLGGKDLSLTLVPLMDPKQSFLKNWHWVVFCIGFTGTAMWSLFLMRGRRIPAQKNSHDQPLWADDINRRLASETAQRRVVEDVLRVNEARWHYVVDNLPVALFAVDTSGMFTLGEGKGLEALGLKAGLVEGNSIYEIFGENTDLINAMRECLGGEEVHDTFQIHRHFFDMRLSPVLTPDGDFEGMICVATDITVEHQMQERLDKVNLHLRGLMENVPTGVAFVKGGVIQWCSRRLEEIFGYDNKELTGRSPEILYATTQSFRKTEEDARAKLLKRQIFNSKTLFKAKDLTRFIGEMTGRLVDPNNLQAGTMWVIQDLSDHLAEETERRHSQAVFDNIIEGVVICNADKQILSVNKAFTTITGYTEKEVLGRNPSLLRSERHDVSFYRAMWQAIDEDHEWEGEIWNKRKNGELYLQWAMIKALVNDAGVVQEYIGVFSDITKHRQTQERLSYQANYDQLTGLPNRHLLADRFHQGAAQLMREGKKLSLVYLGLDNFKYLNESLGHDCGDHILKIIADRLDSTLRSSDTVARIGGDEFVMLLMGVGEEDAAARIVANISMQISLPIDIPDHEDDIVMSASCGIAIFPEDGESLADLTRKADSAHDHAKKTERGMFKFFTEEMNEKAQERLLLEHKLRRAIDQDHLVLYYQPKLDVNTREIYGAEALIRWIDPELGMIGPDRFIPIAEETGLIIPIGEWVFKSACAQFKKWHDEGLPISNVAVNLSGRQFTKPDLANDLIAIIHEEKMDPNCLEIEITESFIANNDAGTVKALNMFSQLGVKLSVDDFGTGYSSLNYLHRFPLDVMKIDRSFIMNIAEENMSVSSNLAKAVIAIAHSMDLKIVGEGVENEVQLDFLKMNGCDFVQGFYFSKPLPVDEFEMLLRDGGKL